MKDNKCDVNKIFYEINEQFFDCITEDYLYPPCDNRCLKSYVRNINGGDNFADYCEYIFELLEEEGYYE